MIRQLITFALVLYIPLALKLSSYLFYKPVGVVKTQTTRADITDSNGTILATTINTQSVYIIPHEVLEREKIINDLSAILNIEREKIAARFNLKSKKFVWIVRHIAPWQASAITQLNYSGVYIANDMRRFYPLGSLFVHIVGRVDDENNGISGIEVAFDKRLKSQKEPLKLSLSVPIQSVVKEVLDEAKKEFNAKSVYGMIVCAKTGRILASYSQSQDFEINPHETHEAVNLNTQEVSERGSIFKVINAAMLLDYGIADLKTETFCPHSYKIGWHTIHDVDKRAVNCVYAFEIGFSKSSNIMHGILTLRAGAQKQVEFFERVGIFEDMKIDGLTVAQGLFPDNKFSSKWKAPNCVTATYGHGIATTNAQFLRAALRVFTGFNRNLHILYDYEPEEEKRIISEATVAKMRYLMRLVFTRSWYGKQGEIEGYDIGGKTGTANKLINGKYIERHNLCNYVFIFPANDPQIIGVLSVDEPHATKKTYGFVLASFIAAPLATKIIKKIGPILGILGK